MRQFFNFNKCAGMISLVCVDESKIKPIKWFKFEVVFIIDEDVGNVVNPFPRIAVWIHVYRLQHCCSSINDAVFLCCTQSHRLEQRIWEIGKTEVSRWNLFSIKAVAVFDRISAETKRIFAFRSVSEKLLPCHGLVRANSINAISAVPVTVAECAIEAICHFLAFLIS